MSEQTKSLHQDFETEAREAGEDVQSQIDVFRGFETQRQRIDDLETRIHKGRERAVKLGENLTKCRERVLWVEKKDNEETEKTGRFYKALWSTLISLFLLLVIIKVIYVVKARSHTTTAKRSLEGLGKMNLSELSMPDTVREILESVQNNRHKARASDVAMEIPDEKEDERLRLFDEL